MKSPNHEEIAQRAYQLWQQAGEPADQEVEIWLEAERQVGAKDRQSRSSKSERNGTGSSGHEAAHEEKASGSGNEGEAGSHNAPVMPDKAEIQADLQKQAARAPQVPHHTAPKSKPAETGKPLWKKPHSS